MTIIAHVFHIYFRGGSMVKSHSRYAIHFQRRIQRRTLVRPPLIIGMGKSNFIGEKVNPYQSRNQIHTTSKRTSDKHLRRKSKNPFSKTANVM